MCDEKKYGHTLYSGGMAILGCVLSIKVCISLIYRS